ncbi:hypothetical protein BDP81DRAFT_349 [Colletotrichum phormii]|uniref:Secreted protein n=1 Tax=Colletotrichum phormii TaxID=359342 RepID=A0AAJ0A540_9PEZI|nr:uncharacterized protein BDP81DRAFT_349 [Colletotrichum phormii]KAK1655177.1 hypothetical protein BDP81DRAFT_349 [Colletotrichum phormii]
MLIRTLLVGIWLACLHCARQHVPEYRGHLVKFGVIRCRKVCASCTSLVGSCYPCTSLWSRMQWNDGIALCTICSLRKTHGFGEQKAPRTSGIWNPGSRLAFDLFKAGPVSLR